MQGLQKIRGCSKCNGTQFETNDQGFVSCVDCGLVRQQVNFDDNVVFGSSKQMQGKNINTKDKEHQQSSQKRLKRVRQRIQILCRQLEINETYNEAIEAANRLIKYADNCNFFKKGKNIELYAAAALYITLRFKKAPFLLIDFSDKMNVNLFKLARCYLKLSKKFGFQEELPLIDPSLFIHRYCRLLNLGDKTKDVTMTAIRLIKRMKRDWMCQGRRPSSLCGAAILIATKIHKVSNPNCSTTQICKTVFVCDETIRRRLDEFKQTKVSKLTPEQFERDEKIGEEDVEMDPPAFRKARLRSQNESQLIKEMGLKSELQKLRMKWEGEDDVPQEIIRQYSDQIAKKYQMASDRIPQNDHFHIDEENFMEEFQENQSNNTGGQRDDDEEDSQVDDKLVFLDEKQQKQRRQIWENQNRGWLDKQAAKVQRGEVKKKQRVKKSKQPSQNLYQAVRNTTLGAKADQQELKKLLSSQPKLKEKEQEPIITKSLNQIFNPFKWNKI